MLDACGDKASLFGMVWGRERVGIVSKASPVPGEDGKGWLLPYRDL